MCVVILYLPFCEGIEQINLAEFQQNMPEFHRNLVYSGARKIFRQPKCGAPEFRQNKQKRSVNFSSLNYYGNPSIPAIFARMRWIPIFFHSGWPKFQVPGAGIANLAVGWEAKSAYSNHRCRCRAEWGVCARMHSCCGDSTQYFRPSSEVVIWLIWGIQVVFST